jgi:hypothetical protein
VAGVRNFSDQLRAPPKIKAQAAGQGDA